MEHRIQIKLKDNNQSWKNCDEFIKELYSTALTDTVIIDTGNEGFSLEHYGVREVLDKWVLDTNRDSATVRIDTPNQFENIGYPFYRTIRKSHFLKQSMIRYHSNSRDWAPNAQKKFGYFVGKYTPDRNRIALDILNRWSNKFLLSVMRLDKTDDYFWDKSVYNIGSLDQAHVADQWVPDKNPQQSLLDFYDQFEIEIVAETFTYGKTFFPTEKTIRPIMGCKPFLIYGPKNFLNNLRLLGFETFDQIWSEEYDLLEGAERWESMKQIIEYIEHSDYHQKEYFQTEIRRILKYNYNHLTNIMQYGSTLY